MDFFNIQGRSTIFSTRGIEITNNFVKIVPFRAKSKASEFQIKTLALKQTKITQGNEFIIDLFFFWGGVETYSILEHDLMVYGHFLNVMQVNPSPLISNRRLDLSFRFVSVP